MTSGGIEKTDNNKDRVLEDKEGEKDSYEEEKGVIS
jgi:hypothetical protein